MKLPAFFNLINHFYYKVAWKSRLVILLSAILFGFSNCVHTDLAKYPKADRTLYLYNITNNSFQSDINLEVFRSLRRELSRRNNFVLKTDKAEAIWHLYGSIRAFDRRGLMYDDLRSPTRLSLVAVCKIRAYKKTGTDRSLIFSREHAARVEVSLEISSGENEKTARLRLSRILAQKIANSIEKEFILDRKQKL